ncbi:hypothetical protein GCM10027613_46360 [Microlunatus endophyticus]
MVPVGTRRIVSRHITVVCAFGGTGSGGRGPGGHAGALPGPQTNQALLIALVLAFATGVVTIAVGSLCAAWVAIGHGILGLVVVLLVT